MRKTCLEIAIIGVLLIVVLIAISAVSIKFVISENLDLAANANLTSVLKNLVQTGFFIFTAILAYLSFNQAKKGLFTPIKTEIFKSQLEVIKSFQPIFGIINSLQDFEKTITIDNLIKGNLEIQRTYITESNNTLVDTLKYNLNKYNLNFKANTDLKEIVKIIQDSNNINTQLRNVLLLNSRVKRIDDHLGQLVTSTLLPKHIEESVLKSHEATWLIYIKLLNLLQNDNISEQHLKTEISNEISNGYQEYKSTIEEIRNYLQVNNLID